MDDGNFSSDPFESDKYPGNVEKRLIEAVRNSNKECYKQIFETYYEQLARFAFRYLKSSADAEEVVQDVFLWIWEKRRDWKVEGTLKTYLFRAVKYKALDRLRHEEVKKRYVQEQSFFREEFVNPQTEGEGKIDVERFNRIARNAIEDLPDRARVIYKLSRLEGLTYAEIAVVLEVSPKTVESQMSRALSILRKRLSKYLSAFLVIDMVTKLL